MVSLPEANIVISLFRAGTGLQGKYLAVWRKSSTVQNIDTCKTSKAKHNEMQKEKHIEIQKAKHNEVQKAKHNEVQEAKQSEVQKVKQNEMEKANQILIFLVTFND